MKKPKTENNRNPKIIATILQDGDKWKMSLKGHGSNRMVYELSKYLHKTLMERIENEKS